MMYRNQTGKKQKLSKAGLQRECTLNHKSKFASMLNRMNSSLSKGGLTDQLPKSKLIYLRNKDTQQKKI